MVDECKKRTAVEDQAGEKEQRQEDEPAGRATVMFTFAPSLGEVRTLYHFRKKYAALLELEVCLFVQ